MRLGAVLAWAIVLGGLTVSAEAQDRPDERTFWNDYGVVVQRNMFSRNRTVRRSTTSEAPRRPEQPYVLTGIMRAENGVEALAFIEDRRSGSTAKIPVGGTVGQGKVVKVELDSIDYAVGGQVVKVSVGENLAGATAGTSPMPAATSSSSGGSSSGSSGGADLLERMRQRRLQEMGK